MPKSTLLSLVLEDKQVRRELLEKLGLGQVDSVPMLTSLFHAARDIAQHYEWEGGATPWRSGDPPLVELDVLMIFRNRIAISFELKWNHTIGKLREQVDKQRKILSEIAHLYGCVEGTKIVLVLPRPEAYQARDELIISWKDVACCVENALGSRKSEPVFSRIISEFNQAAHVVASGRYWESIPLRALLNYKPECSSNETLVGFGEGMQRLREISIDEIKRRPFWNVCERQPKDEDQKRHRGRWHPLKEVQEVLLSKGTLESLGCAPDSIS